MLAISLIRVLIKAAKYKIQRPSTCRTTWFFCFMISWEFDENEQQSENLLLKVDLRSTSSNNFLQVAATVLLCELHDKLITLGEKIETLTQNLQQNNVATREGFSDLVFCHHNLLVHEENVLCSCCPFCSKSWVEIVSLMMQNPDWLFCITSKYWNIGICVERACYCVIVYRKLGDCFTNVAFIPSY